MNASQSGPAHAKAILRAKQTTDTYNPISSPASDITPPLTQSTSGSNNSRSNQGSLSQSPTQPSTPPSRYQPHQYYRRTGTNRLRTRYPTDLARTGDGRTPLHRRGTSQKYEPFEDLLREAGYKETRIFTPETERVASGTGSGDRSKVAGVVEFLSGLIPGSRSSSLRVDQQEAKEHYASPVSPSPSPREQNAKYDSRLEDHSQEQFIDNDLTPKAARTSTGPSTTTTHPPIIYTHNNHSYTSLAHSTSSKHMPPPPSLPSNSKNAVYPDRPSRATAYLKHIASVPDMPGTSLQRSHSNASSNTRTRKSNRRSQTKDSRYLDDDEDDDFNSVYEGRKRGNGEGEEDPNVPPLPKGWLETVTRAILLGPGAAVGTSLRPTDMLAGPRAVSQPHSNSQPSSYAREISPALRQLRQTRSVISRTGSLADTTRTHHHNLTRTHSARSALSSRSGGSERTNRIHGNRTTMMPSPLSGNRSAGVVSSYDANRPRPMLMTRLDSASRSNASDGEIRKARVVCRSAPASRASSPNPSFADVASHGQPRRQRKQGGNGQRKRSRSKSRPQSAKAANEPPSLARTVVDLEGDAVDTWSSITPLAGSAQLHSRYRSGWVWDSPQSSTLLSASQADYDSEGVGLFQNPPFALSISVTSDEGNQSLSEGEESSDNEVDLAKMLRPKPQRQESSNSTQSVSSLRSIRSLRKFLVPSTSASGAERQDVTPVPPLPSNYGSREFARDTVDLTPPTSAIGRWLEREELYDVNDRYSTTRSRGLRAALPSGWIGVGHEDEG
ncbi:hypothetical protein EV360DRAFT_86046 [Lentinula raphanica]|nr:hypothetical protein EV360DRAFT_86046 [Lentinula raphanica]